MIGGGDPFYLKFWVKLAADFRSIFAGSASAVTPSEKKPPINTNRKSTTRFPMSPMLSLSPPPQRVAQERKVSKNLNIWTISCDNSETVPDKMSVTINH